MLVSAGAFAQQFEFGISKNRLQFDTLQSTASLANTKTTPDVKVFDGYDKVKITKYEMGTLGGILLDAFLGFGIGNFAQGDIVGGLIGLSSELVGLGGVVAGSVISMDSLNNPNAATTGLIVMGVGGVVYLAGYIYAIIRAATN